MATKVYIKWEHGDADTIIKESYIVDDLHDFLNFIFELRGWKPNAGWENLGHFIDGHEYRTTKHIDKMCAKYGGRYRDMIPDDIHFSNYRPAINAIWIKEGNKRKHIVWGRCLVENVITLPQIGEVLQVSTGKISGYGTQAYGLKQSETICFNGLDKLGLAYRGKSRKDYNTLEAKVVDIKINLNKENLKLYKTDFKTFHYVALMSYKDLLFTIDFHGYAPKMELDKDLLYIHLDK